VRAINYPYPITDLCVKQNLAVLCADGDWVLPWDDDDIFLPHRIAVTARYIRDNPDMRAFRQTRAWYSEDDAIQKRGNNSLYFGSAAVDRSYYFTCGGASSGANHMGFNDESTWTALEAGGKAREIEPNTADTFFWYRWTGRDLGAHDSTQKKETIGNNCYQRHAYFRKVTLGDPRFRRGPQTIEPIWAKGYTRMVRDAIAAGKGDVI
jgi:hypothetical protein